jgi:AraC-like DNA-binding protein
MKLDVTPLLSLARITPDVHWHLSPERHAHHELIVVVKGHIHVDIDGEAIVGKPGDLLFYRQGRMHEERNDTKAPFTTYGIAFGKCDIPRDMPTVTQDSRGRVRMLSEWISDDYVWPRDTPGPLANTLFQALLAEWQRLAQNKEADLVVLTQQFMRNNLGRPIRLNDIAAAQRLSSFHFLRTYRTQTGRTPFHDLTRLRVERARHLLLATDLPLKAIAPQCGMANAQHLCRLVKQHLKLTPGAIRQGRRLQETQGSA